MQLIIRSGMGLVGLFLGITLVGACGSEDLNLVNACTPGASQACVGPAGCQGAQVCAPDGQSFLACDCGAGTGGSGGSGQASVSSAGTGGAGQGGGATTTTGQGGAGQGGMGTGGMGTGGMGTGGTGGTGGNPTDCAPMEPQNGSNCMPLVTGCVYNDRHCECWDFGGGPGWECDTCPTQEPQDGNQCMGIGGGDVRRCFYGNTLCACPSGGGNWSCDTCPTQAPQGGNNCPSYGLHCIYPQTNCSCGGNGNWNCF